MAVYDGPSSEKHLGTRRGLCDACDADGCAPFCGDGGCGNEVIDLGEDCDGVGDPFDPTCGTLHCGAPSDPLACQCCGVGTQVDNTTGVVPTCCDGSACAPYAPGFCTCDPEMCMPAGGPCPILEVGPCGPGTTCVAGTCWMNGG